MSELVGQTGISRISKIENQLNINIIHCYGGFVGKSRGKVAFHIQNHRTGRSVLTNESALRSAKKNILAVPGFKLNSHDRRTFSVAAPLL